MGRLAPKKEGVKKPVTNKGRTDDYLRDYGWSVDGRMEAARANDLYTALGYPKGSADSEYALDSMFKVLEARNTELLQGVNQRLAVRNADGWMVRSSRDLAGRLPKLSEHLRPKGLDGLITLANERLVQGVCVGCGNLMEIYLDGNMPGLRNKTISVRFEGPRDAIAGYLESRGFQEIFPLAPDLAVLCNNCPHKCGPCGRVMGGVFNVEELLSFREGGECLPCASASIANIKPPVRNRKILADLRFAKERLQ